MGLYNGPNEEHDIWNYAAATSGIASSTTAVTIKAASPGKRNYITDFQISHATLSGATECAIRDGAGGTVLWRDTLATTANETVLVSLRTPLAGSVNTLLEFVVLSSVTGGVFFNAQGYVGR